MPHNPAMTETGGEGAILNVFEEFVRTREFAEPPPADVFASRLPDEESRRSFIELVDSYAWTQDLLPRNVQPNVVLAGRFRLIERLGAGGMGQVWRAEDQKLRKHVAVKVMSLVGSASLDSEAAFERETHLLAQLKHPGIVSVLDSDRDDEHRFLVMDLIEGRSLEQVLDSLTRILDEARLAGPAAASSLTGASVLEAVDTDLQEGHDALLDGTESYHDAVVKVMIEVLKTLEAAHSRLVVHRDLKPGNLMVTAGGQPVLLDFGLGGNIGGTPGDLTSSLFGTFRFVAPEQLARGKAGTDVRTDLYQIGIVLYEFLTLKRCFDTDDHSELFMRISKGKFAMPRTQDPRISRDLEDVCVRAMDVNPSRRYQTATEFRDALERFLRREPVHPDRLGPVGRVVRYSRYTVRRHRAMVLSCVAIVLVGVVGWFVGEFMTRPPIVAPIEAELDGQREVAVAVETAQFIIAILKLQDPTTMRSRYRPAKLVLSPVEGDSAAGASSSQAQGEPKDMILVQPDRTYRIRPVVDEDLEDLDGDLLLSCQLAPDAELMLKLQGAVDKMKAHMEAFDGEWVDDDWMRVNFDELTRSSRERGPRVTTAVLFSSEWERGSGANLVRGVTMNWRAAKTQRKTRSK